MHRLGPLCVCVFISEQRQNIPSCYQMQILKTFSHFPQLGALLFLKSTGFYSLSEKKGWILDNFISESQSRRIFKQLETEWVYCVLFRARVPIFQADFKICYHYLSHKNERPNKFLYFNQECDCICVYPSSFQKGFEAAQKGKYYRILVCDNMMEKKTAMTFESPSSLNSPVT